MHSNATISCECFLSSRRLGFRICKEEDLISAYILWSDPLVTELIDSKERFAKSDVEEILSNEIADY